MIKNINFLEGPLYIDMDAGDQTDVALRDGVQVKVILRRTHFGEPETIRGDCMEKASAQVEVNDTELQIPLGHNIQINNLRLGLDMLKEYSTGPWQRKRQKEIWKLDHSARFFLCDIRYPLVPKGSHRFPISYDDKWDWDGQFYNHYARKCRWELTPVHEGVDIACPVGTQDILAVYSGKIFFVGGYKIADENGREGIGVFIRGDDNICYLYFHLDDLAEGIRVGSRVERGQIIGTSGSSGFEETKEVPHLHFTMWLPRDIKEEYECGNIWEWDSDNNGFPINPEPYLKEWYKDMGTR